MHTVMTLLKSGLGEEATPVVPGATEVVKEHDNIYFAYGPTVPGVNTKWCRGSQQVVAYLYETTPGTFLVIADDDALDTIDPKDEGKPIVGPGPAISIGGVCFSEAVKPRPVAEEILEP